MKKVNEHEFEKMLSKLSENGAPSEDILREEETDAQSQIASQDAKNKEAEFEKLIKGDFKEQFEKRVRDNMKRRFKESSATKEKAAQNEKIIDVLMSKYGIDKFDASELIDAINSDKASKMGEKIPSDANEDILRRKRELELENEQMKKQRAEKAMQDTIKSWVNDEKALKENYPDFKGIHEPTNLRAYIPLGIGEKDACRLHHRWWFLCMPHVGGVNEDGYSHSWWDYYVKLDYVTEITASGDAFILHYRSGAEKAVLPGDPQIRTAECGGKITVMRDGCSCTRSL